VVPIRAERAAGPLEVDATRSEQLGSVAWFVGICLALAAITLVPVVPASLTPFLLAIGPAVVALALAWREGSDAVRRLVRGLIRPPNDARWWLVLLLPVAWALAVIGVAVLLGESSEGLFDDIFPAIVIVPLVVLVPALAEEFAWRGFAVPRLLSRMGPLPASLLLAVPWIVLHLVLQLPGQMNEGLAILPAIVTLLAYSIILTWVLVGSGGSVLLAGLVHAGLNGVAPLMAGVDADLSWLVRAILAAVVALAVIAAGGLRARPIRASTSAAA
jgi:uncharacterized protein